MSDTLSAPAIDRDALRAKYAEERDKRLRAEGAAQYRRLESEFADLAADAYMPVRERAPKTDHVTFAFVGGGFAGLVVGARLKDAGIDDVRIIEKGGDFGGTWYWNRYPGAQCDTASMIYMPLLEETGHMPTEKYAHAPEIREHCSRIGHKFGLYDNALFHTQVTDMRWDEGARVWRITTDRGDDFTAKYVGMGTGPLHVAKLPGLPGIETFKGKSFHTSRWDYSYTGGDPEGAPMTGLADKRVAIIGTGATAVQAVPHLARAAKELLVFQRTPSSVDVRDNRPLERDWFETVAEPGWQKKWQENFVGNLGGGFAEEDLVQDGWTDLGHRIRKEILDLPPEMRTPANIMAAYEGADHQKMSEIRARAETVVNDPEAGEKLKAWYRQLCKRPCFHDDYLQAFNEPGVRLVDTDGQGVERITEHGVVANGVEYPVDCIVYASGFEVGSEYTSRAGFQVTGRGGETLTEHWDEGMRTLHGLQMAGFPNAFMVQPTQAANLIANVPHNIVDHADTIATVVAARSIAARRRSSPPPRPRRRGSTCCHRSCTRLGAPNARRATTTMKARAWGRTRRCSSATPQGALGYFNHIDAWRKSGEFEGLEFA